jgi:hypothetical protein
MKELDPAALAGIAGLIRCETHDRNALGEEITELTHSVYSHDSVYGQFCTIHRHIDCPPAQVHAYLADPYSLMEWTYSVRELHPTEERDLFVGVDARATPIYVRTRTCAEAMTVDYHCAWDQGHKLWMIYLLRVVSAELVLDRPGSVVTWTNCHHPYYDKNPFPELNHDPQRDWVGDWWPLFYAGHTIELANLQAILEHRQRRGERLSPRLVERA